MYAAFIIFTFAITINSCNENPVDKQLNKTENIMAKIDHLMLEDNPTQKELSDLRIDLITFDQSIKLIYKQLKSAELTDSQKRRMLTITQKARSMAFNPNFERIARLALQSNVNY